MLDARSLGVHPGCAAFDRGRTLQMGRRDHRSLRVSSQSHDKPQVIPADLRHVTLSSNESLQLARLQDRPSPNPNESRLTSSQAQARIRSQMPLSDKLKYADYVVDNSGTKPELEKQLDVWVNKIKGRSAGWKKTVYWLVPPVGLWGALVTLAARTWKRYRAKL